MDLSKLPKLSQTPAPPPTEPVEGTIKTAEVAPGQVTREGVKGTFCPSCGSNVPTGQRFCGSCGADTHLRPAAASSDGSGLRFGFAEVWFFGIIGVLLLLWGASYAKFEIARMQGKPIPTGYVWPADDDKGHKQNDPVAFKDLDPQALATFNHTHWTNGSIFILGLALIVLAVARAFSGSRSARVRHTAILAGILAALAATIYNVLVSIRMFNDGVTPMISMLFVAFGGFLVFEQMAMLQLSRRMNA